MRKLIVFGLAAGAACTDDVASRAPTYGGDGSAAGSGGTVAVDGGGGDGGLAASCSTLVRYRPPAGRVVTSVAIAGEWNGFSATAAPLAGPDGSGAFEARVETAPGFFAYKLVLDGTDFVLDPSQGYRKYDGGVENSGLRVGDCTRPRLDDVSSAVLGGTFTAELSFHAAVSGAAMASASATLRHHGAESTAAVMLSADRVSVSVSDLADGKYTLAIVATDEDGAASDAARLVFWVEPEPFDWRDAIVFMIVTDRFENGDPSNDAAPDPSVQDPRADFAGGDLEGVRKRIADGTLDQLGVRAIWLTPWVSNPAGAFLAADDFHNVRGYHGYWPTAAREIDPRVGDADSLHALVDEAHAHGIRVLMDYVVNHVHAEHPYFTEHSDWFRTGCVCGTPSCDWTAERLECLFRGYMPDVDWTNAAAGEAFVDDAMYWIREFDLDGLRVDAVKHVEDIAIANLSTRVKEEFERSGTAHFLMGETAMGWSDCGSVECNAGQYDVISQYVGAHGLDGQFDFVLHHAVPYNVFAYDTYGMIHADFWTRASQTAYPPGAVMTPFIGSHDSTRFITLATYRGQAGYDRGVPSNQWGPPLAGAPPDAEPYERHRLALAWVLTLPGAPLLYYGDEYGEWGGADPGNRALWRGGGPLDANEAATLSLTRAVGAARRELIALRRGTYRSLHATETFLAYAREHAGQTAIVALSREAAPSVTSVTLTPSVGLADGTVLRDRLGGPDVTVGAGRVDIPLGRRGAAILAP